MAPEGVHIRNPVTDVIPADLVTAYITDLARTVEEVRASNRPEFGRMGERLGEAVAALGEATRWIGATLAKNPDAAMAGAVPYLRLFGIAAGGVYLARGALAAARGTAVGDPQAAIALARFFAKTQATAANGLKETVMNGADATLLLSPEQLSA